MNKKLPKVFVKNENIKDNNKEFYVCKSNSLDKDPTEIDKLVIKKKISEIFSSPNFVYKQKVKIFFKDNIIEDYIIGRKNNSLILMDGKTVNIDDLINIEII